MGGTRVGKRGKSSNLPNNEKLREMFHYKKLLIICVAKKIAAELSRAESCANTISPPVLSRRFLYMCPSIISFPHFPHCCLKPKSNPLASYTISCFALFSLNQILCHHNITSMKHPLSLRLVDTKFTMFAVEQGLFEVLDLNFILVWFEGIT